jgi:hypothetical protein
MTLKEYAQTLKNGELAEILEYSSHYHEAEIAVAVMREAAKRLREEPELHLVSSPAPDLPPLRALAFPA